MVTEQGVKTSEGLLCDATIFLWLRNLHGCHEKVWVLLHLWCFVEYLSCPRIRDSCQFIVEQFAGKFTGYIPQHRSRAKRHTMEEKKNECKKCQRSMRKFWGKGELLRNQVVLSCLPRHRFLELLLLGICCVHSRLGFTYGHSICGTETASSRLVEWISGQMEKTKEIAAVRTSQFRLLSMLTIVKMPTISNDRVSRRQSFAKMLWTEVLRHMKCQRHVRCDVHLHFTQFIVFVQTNTVTLLWEYSLHHCWRHRITMKKHHKKFQGLSQFTTMIFEQDATSLRDSAFMDTLHVFFKGSWFTCRKWNLFFLPSVSQV
jgi:hypothetical protein